MQDHGQQTQGPCSKDVPLPGAASKRVIAADAIRLVIIWVTLQLVCHPSSTFILPRHAAADEPMGAPSSPSALARDRNDFGLHPRVLSAGPSPGSTASRITRKQGQGYVSEALPESATLHSPQPEAALHKPDLYHILHPLRATADTAATAGGGIPGGGNVYRFARLICSLEYRRPNAR